MAGWYSKKEIHHSNLELMYENLIILTFKIRSFVLLPAIINTTMNLFTSDISIPSLILNGLTITFCLNTDDLIYQFHTGQAESHTMQINKYNHDLVIGYKWI